MCPSREGKDERTNIWSTIMKVHNDVQAAMVELMCEWKAQIETCAAGSEKIEAQAKTHDANSLEVLHAAQRQTWEKFCTRRNARNDFWGQISSAKDTARDDRITESIRHSRTAANVRPTQDRQVETSS
jgi:hypothetical protein